MSSVTLIFPHQLFKSHPALDGSRPVYLVEEWLFFRQYKFHKQKLVLHRASMQFYAQWLKENKYKVNYVDTTQAENDVRKLITSLAKQKITEIHIADVADNWLLKRINETCLQYKIKLVVHATPGFINTIEEVAEYFSKKKTYFQTDFYTHQRKLRKILLEKDGKPLGGKWTFDSENREKYPKKQMPPVVNFPKPNKYIKEAIEYVDKNFPSNYGSIDAPHFFVCSFDEAEKWLDKFIEQRFQQFGIYEDAIVTKEYILHHSVLTPMLNTGLLTPQQVLDKVLNEAAKHNIPLNSLEGFVRQIMGWREFIRIVYEREGTKQRTTNYWQFKRRIPESFWTGTTGILPIDETIKKVLKTGYCHHIERLMVLGNFMLLCEFDPDEVYRWFMELFIDAYDWVMVPNVYGMTQFADGGLMTTKPYISGSNYLMKMSDYEKGNWQPVWDGLFWRFMHVHRDFFLQNPRLGMLIKTFDKMAVEKQKTHLKNAETFLQQLDQ
ncbi:cryptochrome/photolyase family protein [Lacibacter sp.]|uniref:cryptochrome/photolyase family protein n=1 Tax=Lacibacter sp. TaxID=1915409 RepID=UPI002B4AC7B8|nr:cryptochrome/photolyase family protein [Lacibacter sp.]HLP39382.1 cryptochrome/photolyase family protein [Lacibacter sp.]